MKTKVSGKPLQVPVKLILLIFVLTSGCASKAPVLPASSPMDESLPDFTPARHLVFIGLDGWASAYFDQADMPTVKRMMAGGASSLELRCVMPSNSWPNWAVLFSGALPENYDTARVPSIVSLVKNAGYEKNPVHFYEWTDMEQITPAEITDLHRIYTDLDSAKFVADYIRERKPVFTAVTLNEPDATGHKKRWGSASYYAKLKEIDGLIAIIEQAVIGVGIYDDTVFVLSADHGGVFWGHGRNSAKQREIPLIIYGRIIKAGYAIPPPLDIYDVAPTMAAILGLEIPKEWDGRPIAGILN